MTPEELEAIRQRNAARLAEMRESPLAGYCVALTSFVHGQCYKDIGDLLAEVARLRAALEQQPQGKRLDGARVEYRTDEARQMCEKCGRGE